MCAWTTILTKQDNSTLPSVVQNRSTSFPAFTIANFYYFGLRGAKQDLRLAVKYYEIAGDYNHWEGGGRAGLMHVWGIG